MSRPTHQSCLLPRALAVAMLMTAGLAEGYRAGTARALEAVGDGSALARLEEFVEASNG